MELWFASSDSKALPPHWRQMLSEVVVLTSDRRNWLLRGFAHQWEKYAGEIPIKVVGFTRPEFKIPFDFISLGRFENFPSQRWSDALILYLREFCNADFVTIFLEDYWLRQPVNLIHFWTAERAAIQLDAFRFDLTTDRLNAGVPLQDVLEKRGLQVFFCPQAPYQMSLQASIFSRHKLLSLLVPGESPWEVELKGTERLAKRPDLQVFGQRQWVFNYQIMVDKGVFKRVGSWMYPPRQLSDHDFLELAKAGCLTEQAVPA